MRVDPADLEPLRCDRGCDPRWAQYLLYEGTNLRILDQTPGVHGLQWDIGLRCANCHLHYFRPGVPHSTKQALDRHTDHVSRDLQTLADIIDDAHLRQSAVDVTALLMEENRGS